MPGINLIISIENKLEDLINKINDAHEFMKHSQDYYSNVVYRDKNVFIGYTKYKEYPISVFENDKYIIIIEGMIYNKDFKNINNELIELIGNNYLNKNTLNGNIKKWLLNSDGEYIIIILDKQGNEIILFNDVLGHLPLYYFKSDELFVLSREMKFITTFMNNKIFNKQAIAEYLLLGLILGNKNFIQSIFRLESATKLYIDTSNFKVKFSKIYTFNVENKWENNNITDKKIYELKNMFLKACKNRINSFNNVNHVVSLSGGLDSRTVAAALKGIDTQFYGATYIGFGADKKEVEIARNVSDILSIDWKLFYLNKQKLSDMRYLVFLKDGLNYSRMSFILSFFNQIKNTFGKNVVLWTGLGGGVFYDSRPKKNISNMDELINYLVTKNMIFNLDVIESLLMIDKKEIIKNIRAHIFKYPEKNLYKKYVHFRIYERWVKVVFEGRDRNRFFFWSVSPFYSTPFFSYVMSIPDEQKKYFKLYKTFLKKISPECAEIKYRLTSFPITSFGSYLWFVTRKYFHKLPDKIKKIIYKIIMDKYRRFIPSQKTKKYINHYIENSSIIKNYMSKKNLKELTNGNLNEMQFYTLFTMIEYMKQIENSEFNENDYI